MPSTKLVCGAVVLSSLVAIPALAQEGPPPVSPTVEPVRFPFLPADGLASEIDLQIGVHQADFLDGDSGADDGSLTHYRLGGQYVSPDGFGGFFAFSGARAGEGDDEEWGASNLEVGGLYRGDNLGGGNAAVTFRVGLVLPTADEDDDDGQLINTITLLRYRPSDLITAPPDMTSARIAVAPTWRTGDFFLRGDLGVDLVIDQPDESSEIDPIYHLDVAAGVRKDRISGALGISTVGSTGDEDEGHFHAFTVGGQYDAGPVTPHLSVAVPFVSGMDSESGEEFWDVFLDGFVVMGGLSVNLE